MLKDSEAEPLPSGLVECKECKHSNLSWCFVCFYCGNDLFDENVEERKIDAA